MPLIKVEFMVIEVFPCHPLSHFSSHSPPLVIFSVTLHPIPALDPLTIKFALDVRRDPQLGSVPEAIHFTGEVLCELG